MCANVVVTDTDQYPFAHLNVNIEILTVANWNDDGVDELLAFMDTVLNLAEAAYGFVLTYDVRWIFNPRIGVIGVIDTWANMKERAPLWFQRCRLVRIISENFLYNNLWRFLLNLYYTNEPTPLPTYMVKDTSFPLSSDAVAFGHEFASNELSRKLASTELASNELASNQPASWLVSDGALTGTQHWCDHELPPSLSVKFDAVGRGFADDPNPLGCLTVTVARAVVNEKELRLLMDFMDAFVDSQAAQQGFATIYDLRKLTLPVRSLRLLVEIAEWGSKAHRRETWRRLNVISKVIVQQGVPFRLAAGCLSSFFHLCAPACRTLLMTQPGADEGSAVIFEPPAKNVDL